MFRSTLNDQHMIDENDLEKTFKSTYVMTIKFQLNSFRPYQHLIYICSELLQFNFFT